jgi:hypothetical protein
LRGENIILFTISVHLKSVLIKGVAFGESGLVTRGILYNQGLLLKYCTIELNLRYTEIVNNIKFSPLKRGHHCYMATLTKGHSFYQDRFKMHRDSK